MNVSKINVLNVNKTGVSLFRGDAPVHSEKDDKKAKTSSSTNFLYGAGIVSAGIIAAAWAARAGMFAKSAKKAGETVSQETSQIVDTVKDVLKDREIVKQIPAKFITAEVPIRPSRAERLKANAIDTEALKANINYSKYAKAVTPEKKDAFFKEIASRIYNMTYEEQYEELEQFFKFIKGLKPEEVKFPIDLNSLKRDNAVRFMRDIVKFTDENPNYKDVFIKTYTTIADNLTDVSKYSAEFGKEIREAVFGPKAGSHGIKAAFFTNTENKIAAMPYDEKVLEFKKYLEFIKTLEPKDIENHILFTPGKFDWDKNVEIAKEAIEFVKVNPQYKNTIVNNLLSYEPDIDFAKKLAYAKFERTDALAVHYDKHVDNIISIRKLLTKSGLKCDENARMKNRQDWLDIGLHTPNQYTLGFQYSPRLPEIRRAAFEYDMMNGISRKEADEMIKRLSSDKSVVKKELNVIVDELAKDGIPKDKSESLLKRIVADNDTLKQKAAAVKNEIKNLNIADEKARETAVQFIYEQASKDTGIIQNRLNNTYRELKNLGITEDKIDYLLKQLTSNLTKTETERLYGLTLSQMIEQINAAVI